MAGLQPSVRIAPGEVVTADFVPFRLNGNVKRIIVTPREIYQVEIAEVPGCVALAGSIVPSANLMLAHPFDPIFLLLPGLLAKKDKFREISDIAEEVECSSLLICARVHANLPRVCASKTVGEATYHRLDDALLKQWLLRKFEVLASDINAAVPSFTSESEVSLPAKVSALCILRDLLPEALYAELLVWTETSVEAVDRVCNPTLKRPADAPLQSSVQKQAKPAKAKQVEVPRGMQTITSFFRPKN